MCLCTIYLCAWSTTSKCLVGIFKGAILGMEHIFESLFTVFSVSNIILINVGLILGFVFGAIPGLTPVLGMTLCLPLSFSMSPITAMLFLLGIYCGGSFGGSITAILIGTPGTAQAAATLLDGYPLAKQGKAYKALSMALVASTIGGLLSALSLLIFAPSIAKIAMSFGPPEYFVLAIFGLTIIGAVSGDKILKGIFVGCVGILIAMVGLDNITGVFRFTFGSMHLYSGFSYVSILMGVFALSKVVKAINDHVYTDKLKKQNSIDVMDLDYNEKLNSSDIKKSFKTILKSSAIGVVIGAIPAAGAAIASYMGYNEAKRTSKHPETFGTGEIEGVAASEAANNAVTGSALIPMLTVGIPGTGGAAALMAALTIHGLAPGPALFRNYATEMYAIMIGLIVINLFMYVQGRALTKYFAMVTKIPKPFITAALITLCTAGTYSVNRNVFDIYILVGAGVLFYLFQKFDFPTAPIVLGLILGSVAEDNFRRSIVMSQGDFFIFFKRPICLIFIALTVLVLWGVKKQIDKKIEPKSSTKTISHGTAC